jgi:hypothetical protein
MKTYSIALPYRKASYLRNIINSYIVNSNLIAKKLPVLIFLLFCFLDSYAFSWSGIEPETGKRISIDEGNLVREGLTIEVFDEDYGEYVLARVDFLDYSSFGAELSLDFDNNDCGFLYHDLNISNLLKGNFLIFVNGDDKLKILNPYRADFANLINVPSYKTIQIAKFYKSFLSKFVILNVALQPQPHVQKNNILSKSHLKLLIYDKFIFFDYYDPLQNFYFLVDNYKECQEGGNIHTFIMDN